MKISPEFLISLSRKYADGYFHQDELSPCLQRTDWTKRVTGLIGSFGLDTGRNVMHTPHGLEYETTRYEPNTGYESGEWLYDLIWTHPHEFWISLAMESEWETAMRNVDDGWQRLWWDFSKLLPLKAEAKVLIYRAGNTEVVDRYTKDIVDEVSSFRGNEGLYLCIAHVVPKLGSAHTTSILSTVLDSSGETVHYSRVDLN
jgi:hypothetical protein